MPELTLDQLFQDLERVGVPMHVSSAENHQLISQPCHLTALAWKEKGGGAEIMTLHAWSLEIAGNTEDTDSHAFIINTMSDEPEIILSSCSMEIILRPLFREAKVLDKNEILIHFHDVYLR